MQGQAEILDEAISLIRLLRKEGARVHCITNTVAQAFTANVLLACGVTPSMTVSPLEAASFTSRSQALLVNLGTLSDARQQAIRISMDAARNEKLPVVLDPVMCHLSEPRLDFAREILSTRPAILRVNSEEAEALLDSASGDLDACIVKTGARDTILSGQQEFCVDNGHPWMAAVTAMGCAQGGLFAALASKTNKMEIAALAGLIWTGVSGEIAAGKSSGPGTFLPAYIDTLHNVPLDEIRQKARFE